MYLRTEYEMTETDFDKILDACTPTPVMMIGDFTGSSPQENANRAWEDLGRRMGFDSMTVRPMEGKGSRFFTAIASETEAQRTERLKRESEERTANEIKTLQAEIDERTTRLNALLKKT